MSYLLGTETRRNRRMLMQGRQLSWGPLMAVIVLIAVTATTACSSRSDQPTPTVTVPVEDEYAEYVGTLGPLAISFEYPKEWSVQENRSRDPDVVSLITIGPDEALTSTNSHGTLGSPLFIITPMSELYGLTEPPSDVASWKENMVSFFPESTFSDEQEVLVAGQTAAQFIHRRPVVAENRATPEPIPSMFTLVSIENDLIEIRWVSRNNTFDESRSDHDHFLSTLMIN